jgi:hypothetical protein
MEMKKEIKRIILKHQNGEFGPFWISIEGLSILIHSNAILGFSVVKD